MVNSSIICVLGMARSGTSLTSMILSRLGVYFGLEKNLHGPYFYNQKGSWEHKQIRKVNENIFLRLGGNWHQPPVFQLGWESASEFEDLRDKAKNIILQEFSGKNVGVGSVQ